MSHKYTSPQTREIADFVGGLYAEASANGQLLDSVQRTEVNQSILDAAKGADEGHKLPERIQKLFDSVQDGPAEDKDANRRRVLDAVMVGVQAYEAQHGVAPAGDVIEAALDQAFAASLDPRQLGMGQLDSTGNTAHHNQLSYQPNRVVVAITSAIAEAIPFATMLPADINSNESRLAIVSHLAATTTGDYNKDDLLDGISCGKTFINAERRVAAAVATDRLSATAVISSVTGSSTGVQVLRGRTQVFINGFLAAVEARNISATATNSTLTGTINLAGVEYNISGTVTPSTGAVALNFSKALPATAVVEVEAFIDYEKQPALAPEVMTQAQTFELFCSSWRAIVRQTIDSKTQGQNELGLDMLSESLIALRNQYALERHYMALAKLKVIAANNAQTFNFDYATMMAQKTRAQVWQDFSAVLGICDQQMAEDTMDHGITHLYVGKKVAAQWMALPSELFTPSGLSARPGIFRIGRLFGRFEVYYTPRGVSETATSAEILCIGRSSQVARCPIVMADSVPPTLMPLAMNGDLVTSSALYARNLTQVNPHQPSAKGAALITVTNLFGS